MHDGSQDNVSGADGVLDAAAVRAFHDRLDAPLVGDSSDVEAWVEELRALDELRNALTARQARVTVAVHEAQQARDMPRGIDDADTTRLVGSQVGFARRCCPRAGAAFVNLSRALVDDMPHTLAALASGVISERDATRIIGETTGLSSGDRAGVDEAIAPLFGTGSVRRLCFAAKEHALTLAPDAARERRHAAEAERRVTVRPAPHDMAYLTAVLPIKDALVCQAALHAAADTVRAAAEDAGQSAPPRGQVMADTLVARVTGRAKAQDVFGATVDLIMPLDTLLGDTPAHVPGYGPVPADLAREWVTTGDPTGPKLRRLFTHPGTGDIVGMDSRARRYPGLLARLILFRDQTCRTPWCSAPVRHTDHITAHAKGGATSERNGQGLCERCNYVKEHPDYQVTGHAGRTTTTAGGLTAISRPPSPPGLPPPTDSHPEHTLMTIVWQHQLAESDLQQRRRERRREERELYGGHDACREADNDGWDETGGPPDPHAED